MVLIKLSIFEPPEISMTSLKVLIQDALSNENIASTLFLIMIFFRRVLLTVAHYN
jgi:hypothetical protein